MIYRAAREAAIDISGRTFSGNVTENCEKSAEIISARFSRLISAVKPATVDGIIDAEELDELRAALEEIL